MILFENEKKSFFRKKWEDVLIDHIDTNQLKSDEKKIILKNKVEIENFLKEDWKLRENLEKIVITPPLNNFYDVVKLMKKIDEITNDDIILVVNFFSKSWLPIFKVFSRLNFIKNYKDSLFFSENIFRIFLEASNFEVSKKIKNISMPIQIPILSNLINILFSLLPFLSLFSFSKIYYLRKKKVTEKDLLISIIIPCKNEEGNIKNIIKNNFKNKLSFNYEVIFIDDCSTDKTLLVMQEEKNNNSDIEIKIVNGSGKGKSRAVDVGVRNSNGDYCMILDADITVKVEDLDLFYNAIKNNNADLINGSRLIYKVEKKSMRTLNYFGNIFFSIIVSYISEKYVSDVLCGTKCFKRKSWYKYEDFRNKYQLNDVWGDFNIIFASSFIGEKIIDLPVRYYERVQGESKMGKRFLNFLNMMKVCLQVFKCFKLKNKLI
ncbi:glycosyltransferase family 2 protein [Candidatus Pelagibacter sp.]|nr:glycosyltransferase family 2 protein [Candidatus Pelagibacter sp.]